MTRPRSPSNVQRQQALMERVVAQRVPEFLESLPYRERPSAFTSRDLPHHILNSLSNYPTNPIAEQYKEPFLNFMRGRTQENDPSVKMSQYQKWQSEADQLGKAAKRLTPGGAANFEAEREYNLARSLTEKGPHAASGSAGVDIGLGYLTSPELFQARSIAALGDPRLGRSTEALYWWDRGSQSNPQAPTWAKGPQETQFPSKSPSNWGGFIDNLTSTDTPTGVFGTYSENMRVGPIHTALSEVGRFFAPFAGVMVDDVPLEEQIRRVAQSFDEALDQNTLSHWVKRATPVYPDNALLAADARVGEKVLPEVEDFEQRSAAAHYPALMESLAGSGMRHFPSHVGEVGTQLPSTIFADPLSAVTGAAKVARPLQMMMEMGEESLYSAPLYAASIPQDAMTGENIINAFSQPQDTNPNVYVYGPNGEKQFVQALSPRYYEGLAQGEADQLKRYGQIKQAAEAYRKYRSPDPAVRAWTK